MPTPEPGWKGLVDPRQKLFDRADYWQAHSLADHWAELREVSFKVTAPRRLRVNLEPTVFDALLLEARQRGVAVETLVNLWLRERLPAWTLKRKMRGGRRGN